MRFCLKAAWVTSRLRLLPYLPTLSNPLCFQQSDSMRINAWDGPAHITLHSSGFFRDTERFLAGIWNPKFTTTVANVAPSPQHDLRDVSPLLRELTQDLVLQGSKSPTAKSQGQHLVHLESSFQLPNCCHMGMFSPTLRQ